jgi:predicted nucleotidyltransferase
MRTSPPKLLPIFRSDQQLRMLGRLLLDPDHPATTEELRLASGMSKASLHRELRRAVDAGLVERDESRRPHEFRAVQTNRMYEPVTALVRMTVGIEQSLRELLLSTPGVEAAVLHGSWAEGTARARSDIDLLVVSDDLDARALRRTLREEGRQLGREIDLTLLSSGEFADLMRDESPFLRTVLDRPRVNLVGDITALAVA